MPLRLRGFSLGGLWRASHGDSLRIPLPLETLQFRHHQRTGFTLAEIILALGILCVAILAVAPLAMHLQRGLNSGDTADVALFLASSHVLEEARAHVQKSESGFNSLTKKLNGRTSYFDRDGIPLPSGIGEIACSVVALREPSVPHGGNHLIRVAAKAWYAGNPRRSLEVVTLLAPPPPEEHVIFSGFLKAAEDGQVHWDDYWGGYFGALYGKRQGEAYKAGLIEVDVFPLPAEPNAEATPPAAPTPLPWGWK